MAHIPHIEALAPGSTGNHRPDVLTKIERGEVNTKLLSQFLPKTLQVAYTNNQVKATVILCQLTLLTCLTRMYLTSELSPSLSTPGWTTAVKSSSKIWTTFEWYTLNLRSTSTQTYLYVVMISQRYGRIGCTSCFMCGADLITLITHLPHVACHIDTNPALNHGTITIAISKWCHGDIKTCKAAIPPSSPVPVP